MAILAGIVGIASQPAGAVGYADYISATSPAPTGWWGMNESNPAAATTADLSGVYGAANNQASVNLDMTYQSSSVLRNQTGYVTGVGNKAAYFDGTATSNAYSHATGPYSLALPGAIYRYETGFSVEVWAKGDGTIAADQRLLGVREWALGFEGTGAKRLHFTTFGKQDYFGNPAPQDNQWHLIGFSWDGSTASFYVDGVPAGSQTTGNTGLTPINNASPNNQLNLASRASTNTQNFKGWLDEVVIWGNTRSAADFAASFAAGQPGGVVPPNDDFANAIVLPGSSGTRDGDTNALSTLEANEPALPDYVINTVWYKWTATLTGNFTVSTVGTQTPALLDYDATLDIYDGGPSIVTLNSLVSSDLDQAETATVPVIAGTTYYIRFGYGGGNGPGMTGIHLTWSAALPPVLAADAGADKIVSPVAPSVTLSGGASNGTGPYTYLWSPATGLSNPNIANPIASPTATTVYTLTVTDSASPTPATATDTVTVTYFVPLPGNPNLVSVDVVRADSIAVSGDVTGGIAGQSGLWNRLVGAATSLSGLTNGDGGATGIGLTVTATGRNGFQPGSSSGVVLAANSPERLWVSTNGVRTFAFTGLTVGGAYDLAIFNTGSSQGVITVNGGTPNTGLSTVFTTSAVADSNGKITAVVSFSGLVENDYMEVSGLQLKAAVVSTPYQTWSSTHAPTGGSIDDYDVDGVSNGLEFVLGGTKDTNDLGLLPRISADGTKFSFTLPQSSTATGTTLNVQFSTNLQQWNVIPAYVVPAASSGLIEVTMPVGSKAFARLGVMVN